MNCSADSNAVSGQGPLPDPPPLPLLIPTHSLFLSPRSPYRTYSKDTPSSGADKFLRTFFRGGSL